MGKLVKKKDNVLRNEDGAPMHIASMVNNYFESGGFEPEQIINIMYSIRTAQGVLVSEIITVPRRMRVGEVNEAFRTWYCAEVDKHYLTMNSNNNIIDIQYREEDGFLEIRDVRSPDVKVQIMNREIDHQPPVKAAPPPKEELRRKAMQLEIRRRIRFPRVGGRLVYAGYVGDGPRTTHASRDIDRIFSQERWTIDDNPRGVILTVISYEKRISKGMFMSERITIPKRILGPVLHGIFRIWFNQEDGKYYLRINSEGNIIDAVYVDDGMLDLVGVESDHVDVRIIE